MSLNPYTAAPVSGPGPAATPHNVDPSKTYRFRSLKTLSVVVAIFVCLTCFGICSISTLETVGFLNYPDFTNPNVQVSSDAELQLIYLTAAMGGVALLGQLGAAIAGCMFCYRANANLRSLNVTGLEYTPGWCGGWWFVPIMNLLKPYQAVSETCIESAKLVGASKNKFLVGWWSFWVIGSIISNVESRVAIQAIDLGSAGVAVSWVSTLCFLAAGVLFITIVRSITKNQHEHVDSSPTADMAPTAGYQP